MIGKHTQEANPKPRTARVTSLRGSPHQPQLILSGYYYGHPARILLDCGATGDFITHDYVATHNLPTSSQTPLDITLADGITQETCDSRTTPSNLRIGPYSIKTGFDLTTLNSDYDIILGMPWLTDENPHIDWVKRQLTICRGSCSIQLHALDSPMRHVISALQFAKLTRTCEYYLAVIRTTETDTAIEKNYHDQPDLQKLLTKYHDVFPDDLPPGLPPPRTFDHHIDLVPDTLPPS